MIARFTTLHSRALALLVSLPLSAGWIGCGSGPGDFGTNGSGDTGAPSDDSGESDGGATIPRKHVFVTSGQFDGNLARLGGADSLCQDAGSGTKFGGTWRAWISTSTEDAYDHIADVAPWYLLDDKTLVFQSKAQLRSHPKVPINQDELGTTYDLKSTTIGNAVVLTGTRAGGVAGDTCGDWTTNADSVFDPHAPSGTYGFFDELSPEWTEYASGNCSSGNGRLYCFEQ